MKRLTFQVWAAALLLFAAPSLQAQPYSIPWATADSGGGVSAGSGFKLTGTAGQPDAGGPSSGGGFTLRGGFWVEAVQTPGAPLLKITRLDSSTVKVSWALPADGWVLTYTSKLPGGPAPWPLVAPPYETDGQENWIRITVANPSDHVFLRLERGRIITFDLSPTGTDAAVGLSPLNQPSPPATSTGSGNVAAGGIWFYTNSAVLSLAVGFGSAGGFTDLTGAATALHLHGPATPGQNAGALVDLMPYYLPAMNPSRGGTIMGTLTFPTASISDLLAGRVYLNIHTATYPGGEIRGQLVPRHN